MVVTARPISHFSISFRLTVLGLSSKFITSYFFLGPAANRSESLMISLILKL